MRGGRGRLTAASVEFVEYLVAQALGCDVLLARLAEDEVDLALLDQAEDEGDALPLGDAVRRVLQLHGGKAPLEGELGRNREGKVRVRGARVKGDDRRWVGWWGYDLFHGGGVGMWEAAVGCG